MSINKSILGINTCFVLNICLSNLLSNNYLGCINQQSSDVCTSHNLAAVCSSKTNGNYYYLVVVGLI